MGCTSRYNTKRETNFWIQMNNLGPKWLSNYLRLNIKHLYLNLKLRKQKSRWFTATFLFVGPPGLEPGTPWLWVRCSNQLSYRPGSFHFWSLLITWYVISDCKSILTHLIIQILITLVKDLNENNFKVIFLN